MGIALFVLGLIAAAEGGAFFALGAAAYGVLFVAAAVGMVYLAKRERRARRAAQR